MASSISIIIAVVAALVIAVPVTLVIANAYHKNVSEKKVGNAEQKAREIIDEA